MSEFVEVTERMNDILPRRREGAAVLLDSPCKEIYASCCAEFSLRLSSSSRCRSRRSSRLSSNRCRSRHPLPRVPPRTSRESRRYASSLRSEEHTSELQSRPHLVCRLL